MAAPTLTRAYLRRRIAREMRMPFARRVGSAGYAVANTGGGTTSLVDTDFLKQTSPAWLRQFLFIASGNSTTLGEVRQVSAYTGGGNKVSWLEPLGAAIASGNTYEIHSKHTAFDIHDAIDQAIDEAFPDWFDVTVDETLIILRDTTTYTLPTSPAVYDLRQVYLEPALDIQRGTATGGSSTTLVDTNQNWTTNEHVGRTVAIYEGTGEAQYAVITANTSDTVTVAAWLGGSTDSPDTTSIYVIKDTTREYQEWIRLLDIRTDALHWPTKLYMQGRYPRFEGMALRLVYLSKPAALTSDTDTTTIPEGFIVPKAISILLGQEAGDVAKGDRTRLESRERRYSDRAELYRVSNAPQPPHGTLWIEEDFVGSELPSDYPFQDLLNDG